MYRETSFEQCDALYVVNLNGYIDEHSAKMIQLARKKGKAIIYYAHAGVDKTQTASATEPSVANQDAVQSTPVRTRKRKK